MRKSSIKFWFFIILLGSSLCLNFSMLKCQQFNSIFTSNGSILWLTGNNGVIYRSADAGQTFQNRSIGTTNYSSVTGYTTLYLWIAGRSGVLLKSTNAGLNFSSYTINASEDITSLSFIGADSGWASCSSGKIYRTLNGGLNWQLQIAPAASHLNKIKFVNGNTGIAYGKNGTFLITTNSGINWSASALPVNTEIFSADLSGSVIFAGTSGGMILNSSNLGSTWTSISFPAIVKPDIFGLDMISPNTFYSAGEGGQMRRSTDGGVSFIYQNNPSWMDIKTLFFKDSLNGWALGSDKWMVMRTNNGGLNWYMPSGTSINLSWVLKIPLNFYTSSGNVFYQSTWNKKEIFVTKANTVYRTLDIGNNWSQVGTAMTYGAISNSFFVSHKDTNIFLVAIDSIDNSHGKVLRSTDYGQTWVATLTANRSSDGIPMAIDPNHTDTVYYGPTDSVMFRSTNFGLTWSPLGNYRFENNCAIKVVNGHSNIIIVGSANFTQNGTGYITRSTDYGATWVVVDSNRGPYPEVPAIIGSELDSVLYATMYQGNEGGLKRSTNYGLTWSFINIDNSAWGFDRAGNDPNVICYAPWDYPASIPAYISYDRGVHFTPLPSLSVINNFSVYFYDRNNLLLQQSIGFYKLKADISVPIGIQPISGEVPQNFALKQNYPNPFNPSTNISFELPFGSYTELKIFDALGREVAEPVSEKLNAGFYNIDWNAANFPSGVYFYRLKTDKFTETRKMVLVK